MLMHPVNDLYEMRTATNDKHEAYEIAEIAIKNDIAAGAQIYQERSIYGWDNHIVREYEWVILFKVHKDNIEKLAELIKNAHSYDVPEIVVTRLLMATEDFANWIRKPNVDDGLDIFDV